MDKELLDFINDITKESKRPEEIAKIKKLEEGSRLESASRPCKRCDGGQDSSHYRCTCGDAINKGGE